MGRGQNLGASLRRVSTVTGEDETGHIAAHRNEGILFFDRKVPICTILNFQNEMLITFRPLSPEAELGTASPISKRKEPTRSALAIQQ